MASARIARIAIEIAPPQFVNIIKFRRASSNVVALDTIYEDQEKDMSNLNSMTSLSLKSYGNNNINNNASSSSIMSKYFSPRST
ncbi:hypothetical protein SOVF_211580 [Spinacia oleracea]|nr:hypothetical protein SOVF_211580 [Spinacia oleracea]